MTGTRTLPSPTPEVIERRRQRAIRDVMMEEACWLETGNPIHVWRALFLCLKHGLAIPAWAEEPLKRVAEAFYALSTSDKLKKDGTFIQVDESGKLDHVVELLQLRKGQHLFERFEALKSGLQLDTIERLAIKRLRDPRVRFEYRGPDQQKSLKADAAKHGIKPRTYESRVALARRIQGRVAEIAKNRTE